MPRKRFRLRSQLMQLSELQFQDLHGGGTIQVVGRIRMVGGGEGRQLLVSKEGCAKEDGLPLEEPRQGMQAGRGGKPSSYNSL
jgi:hypothetical protein